MRVHGGMVFAAVMALSISVAARAAVVVSGPGAFVAGWTTRAVIITDGEGITYANADIAPHNLIADAVYIPKRAERKTEWVDVTFDADGVMYVADFSGVIFRIDRVI